MADRIATRESYGNALIELGKENPNVVVLDADLSGSTKSGQFKKSAPDRFFNAGIAECNLMGMATGLALSGKAVFASTFAMFATGRAYEIIRNSICYCHANVKICATHAGLSVGEDGASHQCLEDISLMRGLPGMVVLNPADDVTARKLIKMASEFDGPCYIRLGRSGVPVVYKEDQKVEIGKAITVKEGADVSIISTGTVLSIALDAAEKLKAEGIDAAVLDMHTIKPLDVNAVEKAAKTKGIITVEDHFVTGGLGSAVAEVLADKGLGCKLARIGVDDTFGESGKPDELYAKYGITADSICKAAKAFVK